MFEIGNSLRAARERQALDHGEIELATKIRAKYLRALEAEDFEALPGGTYIRGFLRTYADFLGLDGEIYVEEYVSRFGRAGDDEAPTSPERRRRPRPRRELRIERRALMLVLAGIGILTALVFAAWRYGGSSTRVPGLDTGQRQDSVSTPSIVLRGVGKGTYVVVRRDGAGGDVLLQGTVARGEVNEITGSRFYLLVRRPAALRVTLEGRVVSLPGSRNLRVLVTPERTTRLAQ